jgi:hypothetical protein
VQVLKLKIGEYFMRYVKFGTAILIALVTTFVTLTFISQAAPNDTTIVIKPSTLAAQN